MAECGPIEALRRERARAERAEAALKRVIDVLNHANKVSPSDRMTVYVTEVREAIGLPT